MLLKMNVRETLILSYWFYLKQKEEKVPATVWGEYKVVTFPSILESSEDELKGWLSKIYDDYLSAVAETDELGVLALYADSISMVEYARVYAGELLWKIAQNKDSLIKRRLAVDLGGLPKYKIGEEIIKELIYNGDLSCEEGISAQQEALKSYWLYAWYNLTSELRHVLINKLVSVIGFARRFKENQPQELIRLGEMVGKLIYNSGDMAKEHLSPFATIEEVERHIEQLIKAIARRTRRLLKEMEKEVNAITSPQDEKYKQRMLEDIVLAKANLKGFMDATLWKFSSQFKPSGIPIVGRTSSPVDLSSQRQSFSSKQVLRRAKVQRTNWLVESSTIINEMRLELPIARSEEFKKDILSLL